MTDLVKNLTTVASGYADLKCLSISRVSGLVFGNGGKLPSLIDGADLTTRIWLRAMQWFSDHWPDDAAWPEDVPRPEPSTNVCEPATGGLPTTQSSQTAPSPDSGIAGTSSGD